MKQLESKLQILCVKWFRLQFPNVLIFSIPNGGQRSLITAKILKAEGTVSGVADLQILKAKKGYNGLFIEMKYGKGKQSENQSISKLETRVNMKKGPKPPFLTRP